MESYLSGRNQFVSVTHSMTLEMKFGVPQGNMSGPLPFIICINDIPETASFTKFIMYADDAKIIITKDTIEIINSQVVNLIGSKI